MPSPDISGVLIGGFLALLGTSLSALWSRQHDRKKESLRRKQDNLEGVITEMTEIHSFFLELSATVMMLARMKDMPNVEALRQKHLDRLLDAFVMLPQQGIKLLALRSRLMLHGMNKEGVIIASYIDAVRKAYQTLSDPFEAIKDQSAAKGTLEGFDAKYRSFLEKVVQEYHKD